MERQNNKKAKNKMAVINYYISKSTLNVNGFNSSIKMHTVAGWVKKNTRLKHMLPTETYFSSKDTHIGASEKNGR